MPEDSALSIGIVLLSQRLQWTTPRFATPRQCEKWSHLMPLMTWQLWLAKEIVEDHHLPWHKPQTNSTPARGASVNLFTFDGDGYTHPTSPNPRKVIGLGKRSQKEQKKDLSCREKTIFTQKKHEKKGSLV